MIDGQQRVTAMMTAIMGMEVVNTDFKKQRIKIAFNPLANQDEDRFNVQDNAILKDKRWIADISVFFINSFDLWDFVNKYCEANPEITGSELNRIREKYLPSY
jgi:hypothetical protein